MGGWVNKWVDELIVVGWMDGCVSEWMNGLLVF